MGRFLTVDMLAGLGALLFAVLGITVLPELEELVAPKVAGGFGLAALARWYLALRKSAAPRAIGPDDHTPVRDTGGR